MEINGYQAYVDELGAGQPVVLVHGLGGNATETWKHLAGPLAEEHRVVAYDLRGVARSEVTAGPYTIDVLATDLKALIEALGLGRAVVIGHSLGGSIALLCGALYPEVVSAVVAVGAAVALRDEQRGMLADWAVQAESDGTAEIAAMMATGGTAASFREGNPEEISKLEALIGETKPEGFAALCRAVSTIQLEDRLGSVTAPVLFVAGELDMMSTPALNRGYAERMTHARVVEVASCGHHIEWEKPSVLLEAVGRFLAERGGQDGG